MLKKHNTGYIAYINLDAIHVYGSYPRARVLFGSSINDTDENFMKSDPMKPQLKPRLY